MKLSQGEDATIILRSRTLSGRMFEVAISGDPDTLSASDYLPIIRSLELYRTWSIKDATEIIGPGGSAPGNGSGAIGFGPGGSGRSNDP